MSYDIHLKDPVSKEEIVFEAPHQIAGGTRCLGGTDRAWLNITYNYSKHFQSLGPNGIREIYGKTGAESLPLLEKAIALLGDDVDPDYWEPTEGNAKRALLGLKAFAQLRPDGVWDGD